MAVTIKPSSTRLIATVLGILFGVSAMFLGIRTVFTRAVDETPQAVTISSISATSATVSWETGNAVQGAVKYGKGATDADLTSIAPELEPTKKHKVEITLLEAGTTYYFKIIGGTDTDFDNNGSPWTFTTASEDASIPTTDSVKKRTVTPIQRLVIGGDSSAPLPVSTISSSTINCQTETNCELIKANFPRGCSTSDYIKCKLRPTATR